MLLEIDYFMNYLKKYLITRRKHNRLRCYGLR